MDRRDFFRLSSAATATALLAGCGRGLDRGQLVFINGAEIETLDPMLATAQATNRVVSALFEGLTTLDAKAVVQPGVAEKWEISPDGLTYTFHLRAGSQWSNGAPLTSADFSYAWRRALEPANACEYATQLYYIAGAREFNEGKHKDWSRVAVTTPDPLTLVVRLEAPTPFFLDLCAFATLMPVSQKAVEAHDDWMNNPAHFVGNGPFTITEWRLFDRIRLRKNPRFWNAATVGMETVDVLPAANAMTAFNFFATGQADLMMDKGLAPTQFMDELRKRADFHAAPILANYFTRYNTTRGPFKDPRVRRAFALAVDKKLLTEKITRAGEPPADSLTPPGTGNGYVPPPGLGRDVEKARALLAEAGFPGGKGFPTVYYLFRADSMLDQDVAVELQGMFDRELGVKIQLQRQEWTVYLKSLTGLDYDLARSSWVADYNDPNTFLEMFTTGNGNNRTGWSNPRYDALIAAAGKELDVQKRFAIFAEAERLLISEETPICPLYYYVGIQFYDPARLEGVVPNLLDEHRLQYIRWRNL